MNNLDLRILKSLISNKKCALDFVNECDAKLFSPEVWVSAQAIVSYIKTYKEVPTLRIITEKLSKGNNNEKLIEQIVKTWSHLDKLDAPIEEFKHDLECLKNRFAEGILLQTKEELSKLEIGSVDVKNSLTKLQKTINNIKSLESKKAYESKDLKEYLPTFVERFKLKKENPEYDVGLKTYYSFFDFSTNGLKPADFVIIAGESGFGKSLFLNNIGIQVWLQKNELENFDFTEGKNIIYFSLEMPYEDCFNRVLSRLSKVPIRHIENPKFLLKQEFYDLKKALDFISKYPYKFKIVDMDDLCANDIDILIEEYQAEYGIEFDSIFADYLGIMNPNNNKTEEQDWLKQSITSKELRAVGRKYKKPVFTAAQLNARPGKDSSENIGLGRLARSKSIATHATHVIQIENRPNEENYPDFIYHFIKNRKGPKGKGSLMKDLACATLIDNKISDDQYDSYFINQDDISEELENLEL